MQFLLVAVNAKYIHTNPAVYSLKAYAGEKLKPYISLAEYTINNRMDEILGDLYKRRPDVIGFSCYIWNFSLIRELLRELPKVLPEADIWLGGPEVSFESSDLLNQFPMVKGIIVGEGEETFRDLLSFYVGNGNPEAGSRYHDLKDIPGLVLREGATSVRNLLDINDLPFIYENLKELENKIIYYESGRGCPYRCSYCLSSIDKRVRLRDLDKVKRELQFFLDNRVPQVKLIDRTFNCNRRHAMEIWQYIKENDNGVTNFHFEVAADILDDEELAILKSFRPGLAQLEIGVQTTNPDTLREINRSADISRIAAVVEEIQSNRNIHVHLDLIAGLPFEGYESFQKSFCDVYAMKPEQLQLGFLKVLKGTEIWKKAEKYKIVYQDRPPYEVLHTRWLSYEEILKLKQVEEMVELYYNSNQFMHTLPVLMKEFATSFSMFEKLAEYYGEKGYFLNSPARSYRYQILLAFAVQTVPDKEALFRELLTYDYYLRENAKSRPPFAGELAPYRDQIWDFYQREEKKPELLADYRGYHARQTMKMTHMDVFFYPVWNSREATEMKKSDKPFFVLFDYQKRDALTGEAKAVRVYPDAGNEAH